MSADGSASDYTASDVAEMLGLTVEEVRAWARAGFLPSRRGRRAEYRFSPPDVVFLRTAKGLAERVPARKVRRALRKLKERLPSERSLSALQITAVGEEVVVREGAALWKAESGQGVFEFEPPPASPLAPVPPPAGARLSADDWYELACDVEPADPDKARDAYRQALELDPHHAPARVNLGRLLHEAGAPAEAEAQYRLALAARPDDAIAAFNLGVALEDLGRREEATQAYEHAIACQPEAADAHYNLSRLYERAGDRAAAIRHLKACRKLTQGA